jgi:single-stranded-DNA-specific exonuclease
MKNPIIRRRSFPENQWNANDLAHPILYRIYAARGVQDANVLNKTLDQLLPYHDLLNIHLATALLYKALLENQHIMIVGDFDADGATSTAVAVKALKAFGVNKKNISYIVPNRFEYGYGLSPEIVEKAAEQKPNLIITVDNGISSYEGVEKAKALGISVLITDHHLPGEKLPKADCIINPNQKGDHFPSKNLAGVGVIFYVMLALRAELKKRGWFLKQGIKMPNMLQFLDLVALGTVADVVPLDQNNRILVHWGLERIRLGKACIGLKALLNIAKRNEQKITASDLSFAIGPRLNAAGRLEDMSIGIACLLANDLEFAQSSASRLDTLNQERQLIEKDMHLQAFKILEQLKLEKDLPAGICLYHPKWHQGVIGILASRVKEKVYRPTLVFTQVNEKEIKGSARSIPGLHIRDVLESIAIKQPGLIDKFGGHAMAAGLSLSVENYEQFKTTFEQTIFEKIKPEDLNSNIWTDGELNHEEFKLDLALLLQKEGPWGQNFPEPIFDNTFILIHQFLIKEKYLKLSVKLPDSEKYFDAIAFKVDLNEWPDYHCQKVQLVYRLDVNEYQGGKKLQLIVEYIHKVL